MRLIDIYRLQESGKPREAIQEARDRLREIVAGDKMWAALMHIIGDCMMDEERYDEAFDVYHALVDARPSDEVAWSNRGYCRWSLCQYEEALTDYEMAVSIKADEVSLNQQALPASEAVNLKSVK